MWNPVLACVQFRMSQTPSSVSRSTLDSKSALARLMAEENIVVEHMPEAQTAYFDVEARRLVLPCWKDMDESLYDMLVAHEVGHALFSPNADALTDGAKTIDPNNVGVAGSYLNIVEDARIEKLMKRRYRGLAYDFRKAYKGIWEKDMFGLRTKGINPNSAPLIDRLNIKAKCGVHTDILIQLDIEDEVLFDEMMTTETFDEVVDLAKRIYEIAQERKRNQNQQTGGKSKKVAKPQQDDDSFTSDNNCRSNPGEMNENEQQQGEGDSNATQGDQGEEQNSEQGQAQNGEPGEQGEEIATQSNSTVKPDDSITSGSIQRAVDDLRDSIGDTTYYYDLPESINLDKIIITPEEIALDHRNTRTLEKEYNDFIAGVAPQIRMMAKEFELRKAADAHARTTTAKTGKLDVTQLYRYKFSDDIFLRNAIVKEGKNHGMVMMIDWSSSMDTVLHSTIKQTIMLAMFCRAVNIPFSVYTFSDRHSCRGELRAKQIHIEQLGLFNWLKSGMSKQTFNNMARLLFSMGNGNTRCIVPRYNTSGTPLTQTVVTMRYILPEFRRKHNLQIVNAIILTDGADSHGIMSQSINICHHSSVVLRDRATGVQINLSNTNGEERTLRVLEGVQAITDCNTIGFFLVPPGHYGKATLAQYAGIKDKDQAEFDRVLAEFRDEKFYEAKVDGYTSFFLIPSDKLDIELNSKDDFVNKTLTKGRIAGAFVKTMTARAVNKVLLRRFIACITK